MWEGSSPVRPAGKDNIWSSLKEHTEVEAWSETPQVRYVIYKNLSLTMWKMNWMERIYRDEETRGRLV